MPYLPFWAKLFRLPPFVSILEKSNSPPHLWRRMAGREEGGGGGSNYEYATSSSNYTKIYLNGFMVNIWDFLFRMYIVYIMISVHIQNYKNFLFNFQLPPMKFSINFQKRFWIENRHLVKIHKTRKIYSITFPFLHNYNYVESSTDDS